MDKPAGNLNTWGRRAVSAGRHSGAVAAGLGVLAGGGQQGLRVLRDRYPTVAVTGMTGVGKTALIDRLSHHATAEGSLDAGSSQLERRTRRSKGLRGFRFRVVPGDNAAARLNALDHVFHDEPADGVLHLVANGHETARSTGPRPAPEADRNTQLARELEDWTITAHRIASMAVRRDRPIWMIIVLTKVDLYLDDLDKVIDYYSPGSGSEFGRRIDDLRTLAGGAKLALDVLPVSVEAGKEKHGAVLTTKQRDAYLQALIRRMAQLSGHI